MARRAMNSDALDRNAWTHIAERRCKSREPYVMLETLIANPYLSFEVVNYKGIINGIAKAKTNLRMMCWVKFKDSTHWEPVIFTSPRIGTARLMVVESNSFADLLIEAIGRINEFAWTGTPAEAIDISGEKRHR